MNSLQPLYDEAVRHQAAGNLAAAEEICGRILAQDAQNLRARHMLGVIRHQQGRNGEALDYLAAALTIDPAALGPRLIQATVLQAMGRLDEALGSYDRVLALKPGHVQALTNRGNVLHGLGRDREALESFDASLAADARNPLGHYNRAIALLDMQSFDAALAGFDTALALAPAFSAGLCNRGVALRQLGRHEQALDSFSRALALEPNLVPALVNRGAVLQELKRPEEALESFNRALVVAPDNFEALTVRGYLHWDRFRNHAAALADLERAVAIRPEAPYVRGDLLHLKMTGGDWRGLDQQMALIDAGVREGRRVIRPFAYQALSSSPADLMACARIFSDDTYPVKPPLWRGGARVHDKIRLGYICGAFNEHAASYLTMGLYEAHDRARFEVIALDAGRNDGSATRARLENALDRIIDISHLTDRAAAEHILAEEIDILINVDGLSGIMRMGIFAMRPAPVQVNWLGYPGTLGMDYIDYIIADRVVIPPGEERFFSEKVALLPDTYQPNDGARPIAADAGTRADHGLPDDAFVFCNFVQSHKITPQTFALFAGLLGKVEGSVLWLLAANDQFHANLRRAAQSHGISGDRIVFAPTIPNARHLARIALADLFLDALPYNAHTTASDALWAGVPLVTLAGTAFAGRVAASLLKAVGMEELVTHTPEEFEALALMLARDPGRLKDLRKTLAARRGAPLFDTARYCRHIEAAYERMWAGRDHPPQAFAIGETG